MNQLNKGIYSSITAYASPSKLLTPQERDLQIKRVWKGYYEAWQPAAAVVIQAYWRGFWARKALGAQRAGRLLRSAARPGLEDSAGRVIQRFVRGLLGRMQARERRLAVLTIQRWWRGYHQRKGWKRKLRDFRWRQEAAVDIQRFARGFLVRRRLRLGLDQAGSMGEREREREQAATTVQKHFRGLKARRRLKWLKKQYAKRQQYAAITIQRRYRSWRQVRRSRQLEAASPPGGGGAGMDIAAATAVDRQCPQAASQSCPEAGDAHRAAADDTLLSSTARPAAVVQGPLVLDGAASAPTLNLPEGQPLASPQPRPPSKPLQPSSSSPKATTARQQQRRRQSFQALPGAELPPVAQEAAGSPASAPTLELSTPPSPGNPSPPGPPLPQSPSALSCPEGMPTPRQSPGPTPRAAGAGRASQQALPPRQQQRQDGGGAVGAAPRQQPAAQGQQQQQQQQRASAGSDSNSNLRRSASEQLPKQLGAARGSRTATQLQRSASELSKPLLQRRTYSVPPPTGNPGQVPQRRTAAASQLPATHPPAAAALPAARSSPSASGGGRAMPSTAWARQQSSAAGQQGRTAPAPSGPRQLQPSSRLPLPEATGEADVGAFNVIHHQVMSLKRGGRLAVPLREGP